jgi:hypothetical protein
MLKNIFLHVAGPNDGSKETIPFTGGKTMFSFKGPGLKIFAAILAVIVLGVGVYFTFFRSKGYEKTEATIVSIENDPDYIPDPNT